MEKFFKIAETISVILSVIIYLATRSLRSALLFLGGTSLIIAFLQGFYFLGKRR